MLYHLLYPLANDFQIFNVLKYITFRSMMAAFTAFVIALILGSFIINFLKKLKFKEKIREDVPKTHSIKEGTPTMGGILIVISLLIATLLWADLTNVYIWVMIFIVFAFGIVGFIDDYQKLKNRKGISGKARLIYEFFIAFIISYLVYTYAQFDPVLRVPFFKNVGIYLGFFYVPFMAFVIVGTTNAVNLTDGLDGLAVFPAMTTFFVLGVIAYVLGNFIAANYLQLPYMPNVGELAIFCGAACCAGLGFLWYNCYPAQVFMGNIGSVVLGATIGVLAVITKSELLLVILGGVFVVETLSVILQVASYKLRKKRIFKMAPIHHHFELKGLIEPKVVVRFWIVSAILALLALTTLKLR